MILILRVAAIALSFAQDANVQTAPGLPASPVDSHAKPGEWRDLDRVELIVNEDIITRHELENALAQMANTRPMRTNEDVHEAERAILNDRVFQRLRVQGGQNMGLDDAQIEREARDWLEREVEHFDGIVGLSEYLDRKDLATDEHKKQIRDQIQAELWDQYITGDGPAPTGRISRDRYVRPGYLRFQYRTALERPELMNQLGGQPQRVVLQILFIDVRNPGDLEKTKRLAQQLRVRILDGEDMGGLVEQYGAKSKGLERGVTEPIDEARATAIDPDLGGFLGNAKPGDLSEAMPYKVTDSNRQEHIYLRLVRLVERTEPVRPDFASLDAQKTITKGVQADFDHFRRQTALQDLLLSSYVWPPEVVKR